MGDESSEGNRELITINKKEGDNAEQEIADEVEVEEEMAEMAPVLRRSLRETTKPKYLDDYILLIEEEEGE